MPTLALTNFNIVCASLGGFITLFGLVSYLMKEKFYLSEACKYWEKEMISCCQSYICSDIPNRWARFLAPCHELDPASRLCSGLCRELGRYYFVLHPGCTWGATSPRWRAAAIKVPKDRMEEPVSASWPGHDRYVGCH